MQAHSHTRTQCERRAAVCRLLVYGTACEHQIFNEKHLQRAEIRAQPSSEGHTLDLLDTFQDINEIEDVRETKLNFFYLTGTMSLNSFRMICLEF